MIQQKSSFAEKVSISTQKSLGGVGSLLVFLNFMPGMGMLFGIIGVILWLISIYQIGSKIKKPEIFNKVIISFTLEVLAWTIALTFGLMSLIGFFAFSGFIGEEERLSFSMGIGVFIALLVAYLISIVSAYFYKEAYKILASATNHNLFSTAGLFMYIGAITLILFGIGFIIRIVGWIILAVAFFTAPDEVEVRT